MDLTNVSLVLLLAACAGWWAVAARRAAPPDWPGLAARAGLVGLALVAHLDLLGWAGGLRVTLPAPHVHEVLHYYIGTRYFAELGYTGLYDAVVVADVEDVPHRYLPGVPMRDLTTNQTLPRHAGARAAQDRVHEAFTPARWSAFKRDVAALRSATEPRIWKTATLDHGYNGTPLVTAIFGALASQPWIPTAQVLHRVPWLDPLLFALFAGVVWAAAGAAPALGFLFFALANPLNDYAFVGASYLRYVYLFATAGAMLALARGRLASCGVLLAAAGGLRIFPLAIYAALLLRDVAARDWRGRLREARRLHAAFALATLAILAATSALPTPDGRNPWLAFAEKIRLHGGTPGVNQVHLGVPIAYDARTEQLHDSQVGDYWSDDRVRIQRERAWWLRGAAALLLAFGFAALRRAERAAAVVPGLLAVFCVFPMTHYYWAVLAVLPLALPEALRLQRGLLALFAALALTAASGLFAQRPDLAYALASAELGAFLVFACRALTGARRGPPGQPAGLGG